MKLKPGVLYSVWAVYDGVRYEWHCDPIGRLVPEKKEAE